MQQNLTTGQRPTTERAAPVERARVNLRGALRLLDEPLDSETVERINRLLAFALDDLSEVETRKRTS